MKVKIKKTNKPKNFYIDRRYYNLVGIVERRILANGAIVKFGNNSIFVPFDMLEKYISQKEKNIIAKIAKYFEISYEIVEWMYEEYGPQNLIEMLKEM